VELRALRLADPDAVVVHELDANDASDQARRRHHFGRTVENPADPLTSGWDGGFAPCIRAGAVSPAAPSRFALVPDEIDHLLEEILVDAYGDHKQLTAFEVAFEERLRLPFRALIVGTSVDVVAIRYEGDQRHGLTAVVRRDGETYAVAHAANTGPGHPRDGAPARRVPAMAWPPGAGA
jgi:hypothetical protein